MRQLVAKVQRAESDPVRPPGLFKLCAAVLALGAAGALPSKAEQLFNVTGYGSSNISAPISGEVQRGFSFRIDNGYQATFTKLGIWVGDYTKEVTNGVALWKKLSNGTWQQEVSTVLYHSYTDPQPTDCSVLSSPGFCQQDFDTGVSYTLNAGIDYLLLATYSSEVQQNLTYLQDLTTSQAVFASHITYGLAWSGDPSTGSGSTTGTSGFFGPNIGGLTVSTVPAPPGQPVPAPLPLIGAAMAFGQSRRLRRRLSGT